LRPEKAHCRSGWQIEAGFSIEGDAMYSTLDVNDTNYKMYARLTVDSSVSGLIAFGFAKYRGKILNGH
jgi:hypothetical protein